MIVPLSSWGSMQAADCLSAMSEQVHAISLQVTGRRQVHTHELCGYRQPTGGGPTRGRGSQCQRMRQPASRAKQVPPGCLRDAGSFSTNLQS